MAKSKALKKREKLMREGRLNPEIGRSPFSQLDLHTRKTKTKKEKLYRVKHKNRNPNKWGDDSFYFGKNTLVQERNIARGPWKKKLRDKYEISDCLSTSSNFLSTSADRNSADCSMLNTAKISILQQKAPSTVHIAEKASDSFPYKFSINNRMTSAPPINVPSELPRFAKRTTSKTRVTLLCQKPFTV